MKTHEKIRTMRELNKWSQEEMAEKLEMSTGGYAKIERGDSQLNLARLEQIANIFHVNVLELMQNEQGWVIQLSDDGSNNNHISVYTGSQDLGAEIEKLKLIIQHQSELLQQKNDENQLLKDMIAILKAQVNG